MGSCLLFAGCSDEPSDDMDKNAIEKTETSNAHERSDEAQRPVTTIPTMLALTLDGDESEASASARLQLDLDGKLEFSGLSNETGKVFSVRLTVPEGDAPLRGSKFEFTRGFSQPNEIMVVRGELPNASTLRSVGGSAKFEHFDKQKFELSFEVELCSDPRGDGDKISAKGKLLGAASVICLQQADAKQGQMASSSGELKNVESAPDSKACQSLSERLVNQ